jgi:His/Glu/Gln/Arg/opine family amino acid ABC transporter permease subunit
MEATLVNIRLAAIITVIALLLSTAITIIRVQKNPWVNALVAGFFSYIRGTPLLIQIFVMFYVLPQIGIDLSPAVAGVVAISLNSSVFMAETLRAGLQSMDPGQIEASVSLGLTKKVIWWKVVLPQLFRRVLPVLINEVTYVVKGTALLSVISVVDVLRTSQQIATSSFRPFESLVGAALCFLTVNMVIVLLARHVERGSALRRA